MIEEPLRRDGYASLGTLWTDAECLALRELYAEPTHFRTRIQMERFRFGRGEYQYFAYPLPPIVHTLRTDLYRKLAPIATHWNHDLGMAGEFPPEHEGFLATCHAAGQTRATPLLLKYQTGDFNCLHQDLYGEVAFPFQVIVCLSRPGEEFSGGELVLVESVPRAQSAVRVVPLARGEAVVITTRYRPVQGTRGYYRAAMRHGVSPLRSGCRFTCGLIFHDAQ